MACAANVVLGLKVDRTWGEEEMKRRLPQCLIIGKSQDLCRIIGMYHVLLNVQSIKNETMLSGAYGILSRLTWFCFAKMAVIN